MGRDLWLRLILLFVFAWKLFAAEIVSQHQCSRTYLGRLGNGVISSYNYPFDYRDNLTCVYRIYLDSKPNVSQTVCLTFRRFSLENSSPFCSFDYVELGVSPPVKYCGAGLWQYGVEEKGNLFSNIWSPNLCWSVRNLESFDLLFSSDNSVNGTGFHASFQVYSTTLTQSFLFDASLDQGPCRLTEWTCFNRKCISQKLICNGQNDCGDGSDESYAHARCKGQNVLACDFSDDSVGGGYCGFNHEGWSRSSVSKGLNGPSGDHTNGSSGFYIYSEGNSYLVGSQMSLSINVTYCLSFWYFIYGKTPSLTLSVYVGREQAYSRPEWSRHVSSASRTHRWNIGEVDIELRAPPFQVIFSTQSSNNASGTALDDISITEGSCSGMDISCNFESGLCGWQNMARLSHSAGIWSADRVWRVENQAMGGFGPNWDHSSTDGSGYYLYVSFMAPISAGSQALLASPTVSALPGDLLCLQFWYYMGRPAPSACLLSVMLHHYDDVLSGDIWSQVAQGNSSWKLASVEFEADGPLQIILLASLRSESNDVNCEVAVDQLQVEAGRCSDEGVVVCDAGLYLCSSGHCIDSMSLCDRIAHCPDGSDEGLRAGCISVDDSALDGSTPQTTNVVCPPSTSFLCHSSSVCIPRGWLCDLFNDCGDMSDEGPLAGCPGSPEAPETLPPTSRRESTLLLTPSTYAPTVLDAFSSVLCEFSCGNGACISLVRKCDGIRDCTNGHDESNCTKPVIPLLTFCEAPSMLCLNENRCLSPDTICNGIIDCPDGSDEADRVCSDKLSTGAIAGIVFGCCFSLLLLLLVALIARRRRCLRRKNCPVRHRPPHRPNRPPAHISTVFSVNNPSGASCHVDALTAYVAHNGEPEQQPTERNRDNMGYIDESNRDVRTRNYPSELQMIFGEAPPSYSSVLQDNHVDRRRMLTRGTSADELEIQLSGNAQDFSETSQCAEPPAGHSRNRRSYRSLPPTPARQPLVSHLHPAEDQQHGTQRSSLLCRGPGPDYDMRGGGGEHMYEEASGLVGCGIRSGTPLMVDLPPDAFHHQSFIISPTLSSQRASRIRLGTMALQNRSGTIRSHAGVYSPVNSWHSSGIDPEALASNTPRQLSYSDQCNQNHHESENGGMTHAHVFDEFPSQQAPPGEQFLQNSGASTHRKRAMPSSKSAVCLPSPVQQNTIGYRREDASQVGNHRRKPAQNHNNSRGPSSVYGGSSALALGTTDSRSSFPSQHCNHAAYPQAVIVKNGADCLLQNHRRSNSNGFYGNAPSATSVGHHPSNCDDIDFMSPTCI